jgi:hypothetical protein
MLIRFVIDELDPRSGRRQGLFAAARLLRRSGRLSAEDEAKLDAIRTWFNTYLEKPDRLALSPRPHAKEQALSWFKDTATKHIANMRAYADILEHYGLYVRMVKTDRPGYVLYEDEYQIAAYPFADTQT